MDKNAERAENLFDAINKEVLEWNHPYLSESYALILPAIKQALDEAETRGLYAGERKWRQVGESVGIREGLRRAAGIVDEDAGETGHHNLSRRGATDLIEKIEAEARGIQ